MAYTDHQKYYFYGAVARMSLDEIIAFNKFVGKRTITRSQAEATKDHAARMVRNFRSSGVQYGSTRRPGRR